MIIFFREVMLSFIRKWIDGEMLKKNKKMVCFLF